MTERRDEDLSHIYRDAEGPRPSQRVDDNILAASQRVAGTIRRPAAFGLPRRWGTPVAIAATVLVSSTVALMVFERQSGVDTAAPKAPQGGRTAKVTPAAPVRVEQPVKSPPAEPRAEPAAKSPPAELPSAAPAPAAPSPQGAAPLDRARPATVETALSGERRATGQPARVPAVPPGVEILRKSEELKPAPAAAAPGANARASTVPPQPPVPDAQRVFDAQQQAAGANTVRESASATQGVVGGLASRVVVSEGKERTPEKWLADIRKLKTEGKAIEAERELAEFKKRYPDYILPEDLR
jgi:hypothetical protein